MIKANIRTEEEAKTTALGLKVWGVLIAECKQLTWRAEQQSAPKRRLFSSNFNFKQL
jgi:hypothetical protein